MSTWESGIAKFKLKLDRLPKEIHANVAFKLRDSVKFGPRTEAGIITTAPGQPQDTGNLQASWQLDFPEPLLATLMATGETPDGKKVGYARAIEEGIQEPYTTKKGTRVTPRQINFGKSGGGPHSVRLTVSAFDKLVAKAVQEEVT